MTKTIEKYIQVYLTHSELFDSKKPRNELVQMINNAPLLGLFIALSVMSFAGKDDRAQMKQSFRNFIINHGEKIGVLYDPLPLLAKRSLYAPQATLATWKWLLAYGDVGKIEHNIDLDDGINLAILLQAAIADYLYEEEIEKEKLIIYEIFRNSLFNTHDNLLSMLGRTKIIYSDIARQAELFDPKEYVDINFDFEAKYGYSIEDYLVAVTGLLALYQNSGFTKSTLTDLDLFNTTKYNKLIHEIMEPLCFSVEEGREWAIDAINNSWDFRLFRRKPFLKLQRNMIIPLSIYFLSDQIYLSLYWKIRNCYPKGDTNFQRFYGRPFEIYIQNLLDQASFKSKLKYTFVPEFMYGKNQRRSPDGMLALGDKLLVIEGKAKGVTDLSAIVGDPMAIEEDYQKLVLAPYEQTINRLLEIKADKTCPVELSDINNIYIITVNQNNFPHIPPYEDRIIGMVKAEQRLPIKYFGHYDIQEFEQLCYLIGRPNKNPVFKILDNHIKLSPYLGFKNFLHSSSLPKNRPKDVSDAARDFIDYSLRRIF